MGVALLCPSLLPAQGTPASRDSLVRANRPAANLAQLETTKPQASRWRHTKVGALTGGAIGFVAGAALSTQMGIGCLDHSCNRTRTRIGYAAYFGTLGGISAALVGGTIGAIWPVSKAPK